jgi:hypothetical protein
MTNGNGVLKFEERHCSKLCELFIQNYVNEWNEVVTTEFDNFEQHKTDPTHQSPYDCEMDGHDYYIDC